MRKIFLGISLLIFSSFLSAISLFYIPKWEYIQVDSTQVIYDLRYQERAKLIASFLHYIIREEEDMKELLKSDRIIIDANFMADNLNFDFYNFVESSFKKNERRKLDYDPISLNNLQQLTEFPISLNFNEFKKDFLQYTYNLTRGRSLQNTKKVLYPDWFENPKDKRTSFDLLEAFQRKIELNAYDNYRDFALNNQDFTINQLLNSSYLRKQPSQFYLGILAQEYFMLEFGLTNWEKIARDVEYFDNIFFPYSRAFKKHTGLSLDQFYKQTHNYYKDVFQADISSLPPDVSKALFTEEAETKNKSYTYPHFRKNGDIIAVYSSYDEAAQIVAINQQNEITPLAELGYTNSEKISLTDPYLLWSQDYSSPNFDNISNSRIVILNLDTNEKFHIEQDKILLQATLDPSYKHIALVSYNEDFKQNILFLDFPSGQVIHSLANPNCYTFHDLTWINQNEIIYVVENFLGQSAIYKYNFLQDKEVRLSPYSIDPIADLSFYDNVIYFTYPVNNVFNICSLALNDTIAYQTFYPEVSASQASINSKTIIFSSNRYWGKQLRFVDIDKEFWTPILWNDYQDLTQECSSILKIENAFTLESKKLNPFYDLLNFKRIRLSYDQKEAYLYSISQNPTKTFTIHAKSQFNFSNRGIKTTLSNIVSKHYPNILSEISHANSNYTSDNFEEITYGSSFKLPYYFTSASYSGYLNFNLGLYHLDRYKSKAILNFLEDADLKLNYLRGELSLNYSKIRAKNNFYSPFGQNYLLSYKKSLKNNKAEQLYALADFSFLGLRKTDSILLENSFIFEKNSNTYLFGNTISNVYGYTDYPLHDRIYKSNIKYYFPLLYPEKGISNVVYLKRIYSALLAGYSKTILQVSNQSTHQEQNILGSELIFDYNLLDSIEFKLGFRYTYTINRADKHQFDLFIPFTSF